MARECRHGDYHDHRPRDTPDVTLSWDRRTRRPFCRDLLCSTRIFPMGKILPLPTDDAGRISPVLISVLNKMRLQSCLKLSVSSRGLVSATD